MKLILHKEIFNDVYLSSLDDYSKRYEIYYGGAGSGKSVFVAQKLVKKALTDRRKILVLRKVDKTTKNSTFQLLLDTLTDWKIIDKCKINRTDFTITLPNGSVFLCCGLQDPERIKSITGLTDAWLEEATEFNQEDFNQIDLRIRHPEAKGQQIILSFNPVSKVNWCYKLFFKEAADAAMTDFRAQCKILHTNYLDNKFLPQSYIDSLLLLKATNLDYYKIYALGEFGSLSKLVFNNWKVEEFDCTQVHGDLCVGLDFGFIADPTALVASIVDDENKKIYVFNAKSRKGLLNNEIAEMIKAEGFAKSSIIADSAEQKSIEEIKREGISRIKPATKGQGSILQGIQKLQQYQIIVHPSGAAALIEELKNYCWEKDKKTNEYINKPIDKYNHCIDALRYSLQCMGHKVKTMDKALLGL
jgi:phage terminase large subunit|nr:MAG TPA: terminase large subunit [Caudoviricetes sp.]